MALTNSFFGSALNNFGVRINRLHLLQIAPSPRPKESETRLVDPKEREITILFLKFTQNIPNIETDWRS
jgi:peptide chain release factor 3